MHKRNPTIDTGLKILSGVFLLLSLVSLAAGILTITQIQFPTEMLKQPITPHMIFRDPSDIQIWGYPTTTQNMALSHITSVFASLAFAAYFAVFIVGNVGIFCNFAAISLATPQ